MSAVPYACGSPLPKGPAGRVPQCVSTLRPSLAVQPLAWLTAQRWLPLITSARAFERRKTPGAWPAVRSNLRRVIMQRGAKAEGAEEVIRCTDTR